MITRRCNAGAALAASILLSGSSCATATDPPSLGVSDGFIPDAREFGVTGASPAALPDRAGLGRDTLYLLGYQVAAVAVIYQLPEDISNWDAEKKRVRFSKWWKHVTTPHWDNDLWFVNYLLHPYFGAAYYVRARERGFPDPDAFWYSAAMSALFEFGVEALYEPVSIQDLIVTPVAGSLLGDCFMGVRERIAANPSPGLLDRAAYVLTDPLGALNRQVDHLFGRETALSLVSRSRGGGFDARRAAMGQNLAEDADRRRDTGNYWGLALTVTW